MKWKWVFSVLVIVSLLLAVHCIPASADNGDFKKFPPIEKPPSFVKDEIIVKFKPGVSEETVAQLMQKHGTSVLGTNPRGKFKLLRIPPGKSPQETVAALTREKGVEYAELNSIAQAFWEPNDQYYSYQWHLDNPSYGGISCEEAWELNHTSPGQGVVVAVLDTGVAYEDYGWSYKKAPDLAQTSFTAGWDFINNDAHPNDDHGHGTHVTGTIAQSTNNTTGVAGVAFKATIMPVKVLNSQGSGTANSVASGIYWAADHGAKAINLSLGWPVQNGIPYDPGITIRNAIKYAYEKGVTIVAAAGNDSASAVAYPAAYDSYVIAVGATRYDESRAPYSNTGTSLDLTAPGGDTNVDMNRDGQPDGVLQQTFSSYPTRFGYYWMAGTSCAAPHVTGVAALVIASGITGPDNVRAILEQSAEDHGVAGWDSQYGWGIVDACGALQSTLGKPPVADPGGPYQGTEDTTLTFDGSASYDPEGAPLTYKWDFGDGTPVATASTPTVEHTYTIGQEGVEQTYQVTLIVNDGRTNSAPAITRATVQGVNDPPVADADGPYSGIVGQTIFCDGSGSSDEEGQITSYTWNFGDGTSDTVSTATVSHTYTETGTYEVTLTVQDENNATNTASTTAEVTTQPAETEVFFDSFEDGKLTNWVQDSQQDWFCSTQRAVEGSRSAEVDGWASDARLTLKNTFDLSHFSGATLTYSWLIESGLDTGEYLALDLWNGTAWKEVTRLRGNVDPENVWHNKTIDLGSYLLPNFKLRFRGKMSDYTEDANVDVVKIIGNAQP